MVAVRALPEVSPEQRIVVYGVAWRDYVIAREALDNAGLRMTYCEGTLELMSPSRLHELWKTTIARLLELHAFLLNLPLNGYGSTTFRKEAKERGAEPDECYCVGRSMEDGEFPDIVLEVIHTSPLLDKLHVYQGFEIPEVWLFEEGVFRLFELRKGAYVSVKQSKRLPDIDFGLIARLASSKDQQAALRELRLRTAPRPKTKRRSPRGSR